MVRAEVIPNLLKNPLIFYSYDIQESDTPEIIASKYYGDPYRYWLVLFANQIFDAQWQWPMKPNLFNDYIIDKYQGAANTYYSLPANTNANAAQILAYTQGTIQSYNKTITTTDSTSGSSNTIIQIVDQGHYNNLVPYTTTQTFNTGYANGSSVTVTVSKYTQSIYDYEVQQNENNRTIYLINSNYVSLVETQFKSLMGT
jgi:hypothetical protein